MSSKGPEFVWGDDFKPITEADNLRVARIMYLVDRGMTLEDATYSVDVAGYYVEIKRTPKE